MSSPRIADLDARLARLFDEAARVHAGLTIDRERFLSVVRGRLAEDVDVPLDEALGALHVADLFLAFACAERVPGASTRLDAVVRGDIERVAANQRGLGLAYDELRQLVLERVLVQTTEAPPKIASYSGRGPLRAWIRVAATRIALDLGRKKAGEVETPNDGTLFDRLPGAQDPEMAYMRSLYMPELQAAFEAAFKVLTPRQRTVLRQRFAEQLTADAIARIHDVHRATVHGWIDDARATLIDAVKRELRVRVRGTDETLDSVMALVARGVDISVGRLLGERP